MKVEELLEVHAEYIPRDKTQDTAEGIARQLIQAAYYKSGGKPGPTREMATQLANRFHSNVVAAIDDQLQFSQMKNADVRA